MSFKDGSTTLGTVTLSGSSASFTTSSLATGNRSMTARYNGDGSNAARTSSVLTQSVLAGTTPAVSISAPANNAVFTEPADLTIAGTATASSGRSIADVVIMQNGRS